MECSHKSDLWGGMVMRVEFGTVVSALSTKVVQVVTNALRYFLVSDMYIVIL